MENSSKPAPIVFIAIYSGLFGVISAILSVLFAMLSNLPNPPVSMLLTSFVLSAVGVLLLAVAYGVWTRQGWGRTTGIVLYIIMVPLGIAAMFPWFPGQKLPEGNFLYQVIFILIHIAIVIYLWKLKNYFLKR